MVKKRVVAFEMQSSPDLILRIVFMVEEKKKPHLFVRL